MSAPEFLPFARPAIDEAEIDEMIDTLRSGWITLGPKTKRFETDFARYLGVRDAVALSSGTAGLHLALLALGVGPGDEVILPTFTFASTATVVMHVGATPVLVDIEPRALTIDPAALEAAVTRRTRAIIPVHLGGTAADMDAIMGLSARRKLLVIEDAAHALPTRYDGRLIGTFGDATVFSFYATKTLATGDGGALVAREAQVLDRVRLLSLHGMDADAWRRYGPGGTWRYDVTAPGFKYNFTDLQASLGIHQLRKLESHTEKRTRIAERYLAAFAELPGLTLPRPTARATHAWHLFSVRFSAKECGFSRDDAIAALREAGIGTSVHFIPLHRFTLFREHAAGRTFPVADRVGEEILSLPIYPTMTDRDVERVIDGVRALWRPR